MYNSANQHEVNHSEIRVIEDVVLYISYYRQQKYCFEKYKKCGDWNYNESFEAITHLIGDICMVIPMKNGFRVFVYSST